MNKYLLLVNPWYKCPDNLDFKIVDVNSRYAKNVAAEEKTYLAFKELQKYALENGYDIDIESGYRSIEHQIKVYEDCVNKKGLEHTKKYVAMPGYSEHHTGLAIDICLKNGDKFLVDHDLPDDFNAFLKDNAFKYDFIIRYPKGKENITGYNSEPWHLRYVGGTAKYIGNNNLTLEEYLDTLKEPN